MRTLPIAELMRHHPETIPVSATLYEAAQAMRDARIGALVAVEDTKTVGIVTETDMVRKVMAARLDPARETVRTAMSSPLIAMDRSGSAQEAITLMGEHGIRHLPITEDGKVIGLISARDLLGRESRPTSWPPKRGRFKRS